MLLFCVWFCPEFLGLPDNEGALREIPILKQAPYFREEHWRESLTQKPLSAVFVEWTKNWKY